MLNRSFCMLLAATPLVLLASTALGDDWVEYSSRNFTLFSDAPEHRALALLRDMEEFRHVALAVMNQPDQPNSHPLKIVYPVRLADFRAIGTPGFFYHAEFSSRLAVQARRSGVSTADLAESNKRIVNHEYVHYLTDRRSGLNYPAWYREGLAQVLMTAQISDTTVTVGLPLGATPWSEVHATVEDIIEPPYGGDSGEFYLMAWLLTHYLVFDVVNKPQGTQQLADYLRRYNQGETSHAAFSASFGVTMSAMQTEVEYYRRQSTLRVLHIPRSPYAEELAKRPLLQGEELYLLGDLAVELKATGGALELFDRFEKDHDGSPFGPKVASRRLVALIHEERLDEADALLAEILAAMPEDGDILADVAQYFHERFRIQSREGDDLGAQVSVAQSIRYGELAIARNPRDVEALFYLGRAYAINAELSTAINVLLRAFEQAPGVDDINAALAHVLYQTGAVEDAIFLISRNYSATHSEKWRDRNWKLLEQMRQGSVDQSLFESYAITDIP